MIRQRLRAIGRGEGATDVLDAEDA